MTSVPRDFVNVELHDEHKYADFEYLCHVRKTPTVLYGIFVELTRQFYMNQANLPFGTPAKIWTPDPKTTQIWIDTELRWEDEHPEFRPAIYVELSPIAYTSLTGRKDGLLNGHDLDSELYFSRSGKGTVTFKHIAGTDGEACALADATMDYFDAFGSVIRDDFCFTSFALSERIPLSQMPKESKERYASVVRCAFEFEDTWTLKLEAERLKVITFNAGQRLMDTV